MIETNYQLNKQLNLKVKVLTCHLDDQKTKICKVFSELYDLVDYVIWNI